MSWIGYAGLLLAAVAGIVVLAGVVAALPASLRLWRTSEQTRRLVEMYRQTISLELEESGELAAEREALLRPYRRLRRVATHPLVIALVESLRLRRRRAREAAAQ